MRSLSSNFLPCSAGTVTTFHSPTATYLPHIIMATNKEPKPTKRISSLFSLGSQQPKVQLPPSPSPSRPSPTSRKSSPVGQRLLNSHSPTPISAAHSPSLSISHAPDLADVTKNGVLLPPPLLDNSSLRTSSPTGSRPGSSAGSAPGSRPGSPARHLTAPDSLLRPLTPTTEARQAKRRSWLPGRSHGGSPGPVEAAHGLRAWVSGAGGRIPYDLSCLVNAQNVRPTDFTSSQYSLFITITVADILCRSQSFGMRMGTLSSTFTLKEVGNALPSG